jgi:hypothetical protein
MVPPLLVAATTRTKSAPAASIAPRRESEAARHTRLATREAEASRTPGLTSLTERDRLAINRIDAASVRFQRSARRPVLPRTTVTPSLTRAEKS